MADKHEGTILLADDDCENAGLIRSAFRRAGFQNPIHAVEEGQDAIRYFKGKGEYGDRAKFALPELVLLDTNMRGLAGWEVLAWLRQQPQFLSLPVVVFTGSDDPRNKAKAESMGANAYEIKPQEFDVFVQVLKRIGERWLRPAGD